MNFGYKIALENVQDELNMDTQCTYVQ